MCANERKNNTVLFLSYTATKSGQYVGSYNSLRQGERLTLPTSSISFSPYRKVSSHHHCQTPQSPCQFASIRKQMSHGN